MDLTHCTATADKMYDSLWRRFFCEKTSLFYDYLSDGTKLTEDLPTLEEIASQTPNPCGWCTGMEDSMLNACNVLCSALRRYDRTADPAYAQDARKVLEGMRRCITVSGNGFLARSISPIDGRSHYINSSRDQYTHFVFATLRFLAHPLATAEEKKEFTQYLCDIADRGIRNVTRENKYDMLREDGKPGLVCAMAGDGIDVHESMRLPMFYLAAWHCSGNEKYLDACDAILETALSFCERITFTERSWRAYALMQMQYSLRGVLDLHSDKAIARRILDVMSRTADYAEKYPIWGQDYAQAGYFNDRSCQQAWRRCPIGYRGCISGYAYMVPEHTPACWDRVHKRCRETGEGIIMQLLVPGRPLPEKQQAALADVVMAIDPENFTETSPVLLLDAFYSALAR